MLKTLSKLLFILSLTLISFPTTAHAANEIFAGCRLSGEFKGTTGEGKINTKKTCNSTDLVVQDAFIDNDIDFLASAFSSCDNSNFIADLLEEQTGEYANQVCESICQFGEDTPINKTIVSTQQVPIDNIEINAVVKFKSCRLTNEYGTKICSYTVDTDVYTELNGLSSPETCSFGLSNVELKNGASFVPSPNTYEKWEGTCADIHIVKLYADTIFAGLTCSQEMCANSSSVGPLVGPINGNGYSFAKNLTCTPVMHVDCAKLIDGTDCADPNNASVCSDKCDKNTQCFFDKANKVCKHATAATASQASEAYNTKKYEGVKSAILPECAIKGDCRNINDLLELLINIGNFMFATVGAIAFAVFVAGGVTMVMSFGNSDRFHSGMSMIKAAVIGLVIIFSAYLLIHFFLDVLSVKDEFTGIK